MSVKSDYFSDIKFIADYVIPLPKTKLHDLSQEDRAVIRNILKNGTNQSKSGERAAHIDANLMGRIKNLKEVKQGFWTKIKHWFLNKFAGRIGLEHLPLKIASQKDIDEIIEFSLKYASFGVTDFKEQLLLRGFAPIIPINTQIEGKLRKIKFDDIYANKVLFKNVVFDHCIFSFSLFVGCHFYGSTRFNKCELDNAVFKQSEVNHENVTINDQDNKMDPDATHSEFDLKLPSD